LINKDFDSHYEAEEAVDGMHEKELDGYRLTVEPAGRDRKNRRGP